MTRLVSTRGHWSGALNWAANIAAALVLLILLPIAIHAYRTRPPAVEAQTATPVHQLQDQPARTGVGRLVRESK